MKLYFELNNKDFYNNNHKKLIDLILGLILMGLLNFLFIKFLYYLNSLNTIDYIATFRIKITDNFNLYLSLLIYLFIFFLKDIVLIISGIILKRKYLSFGIMLGIIVYLIDNGIKLYNLFAQEYIHWL